MSEQTKDGESEKVPHPQPGPDVQITVDDKPIPIHRGRQTVVDIKKAAGVPLANRLDQLVNGVLTGIDQEGAITIHGGEVFVSFLASGGSS